MIHSLTGLVVAGAVSLGGPVGPHSAPYAGAVHLEVDHGRGVIQLVGRSDATGGASLLVVALERGAERSVDGPGWLRHARPLGRAVAGPLGDFSYPIHAAALETCGTLAVVWSSAGGTPAFASTAVPLRNPAVPGPVPPARRTIIVTEFMKNPAAVSDVRGEWLEVHNQSGEPVDLDGWTLRDDGTNNTVLAAPGGGGVIPAGGFLVLGRNGDPALNGGITVDVTYSGFTLGNDADQIVLEAPGGHEIDRVDYGDGPLWPDESGRSVSLSRGAWGSDLALLPGSWCSSVSPLPSGDMGTPGALNDPCGP